MDLFSPKIYLNCINIFRQFARLYKKNNRSALMIAYFRNCSFCWFVSCHLLIFFISFSGKKFQWFTSFDCFHAWCSSSFCFAAVVAAAAAYVRLQLYHKLSCDTRLNIDTVTANRNPCTTCKSVSITFSVSQIVCRSVYLYLCRSCFGDSAFSKENFSTCCCWLLIIC